MRLVLFLLLSWTNVSAKIDTVYICSGYIVSDSSKKQPISAFYTIKCTDKDTCYSRNGLNFYAIKSVNSSSEKDYIGNEYDKGHLISAEACCCNKKWLKESFVYPNSSLQNESLNRGLWRVLESIEKRLAENGEISVRIEVLFDGKKNKYGTWIPKGYYKEIYKDGILLKKYYFPNSKPKCKNLREYEIR